METLSEHNKRVGDAGVSCDDCGAGMNYDWDTEQMERQSFIYPPRQGRPVKCPKCHTTGRLFSGW